MSDRLTRWALLLTGALCTAGVIGYYFQLPWATDTWPWKEGRLSNIFVSSVFAAVAAAMFWVGLSRRFGGAAGGFLHVSTMLGGIASVLYPLGQQRGDGRLIGYAVGTAAAALVGLLGFAWARRRSLADTRPLPTGLRIWCLVYVLILLPAGTALILGVPGIMPWPLKPETSMVYGWVFVAAAWSLIYPLLQPRVEHVRVGLFGFLAYDLVLLLPFTQHFATVRPELRASLTA